MSVCYASFLATSCLGNLAFSASQISSRRKMFFLFEKKMDAGPIHVGLAPDRRRLLRCRFELHSQIQNSPAIERAALPAIRRTHDASSGGALVPVDQLCTRQHIEKEIGGSRPDAFRYLQIQWKEGNTAWRKLFKGCPAMVGNKAEPIRCAVEV